MGLVNNEGHKHTPVASNIVSYIDQNYQGSRTLLGLIIGGFQRRTQLKEPPMCPHHQPLKDQTASLRGTGWSRAFLVFKQQLVVCLHRDNELRRLGLKK